MFFQWFVAPEGQQVGSLKRQGGASWPDERWKFAHRCGAKEILKSTCTKDTIVGPLLEVAMSKKCTPLWREAYFRMKMYKTHHSRTTFGNSDVEKVRKVVARSTFRSQNVQSTTCSHHFWRFRCRKNAVVARSTFRSQNVQNTTCSRHFWKLRCRKSARRCGAKRISEWKCTKHTSFGPLLEVEMSKKCTTLWREAHFEVKMYKALHVRTTFGGSDVEKVHAVVARSTFRSQNVQNTTCSRHFWKLRCRKSARRCGAKHISKSKCTKHLSVGPLLEVQMSLRFTTLHYFTLHYTPLHYAPLHYTTLHNTTTTTTQLHSTTLRYTKLHYTTLHYITLHSTTLHYTTLHYLPLHYTTLRYTSTTTTTTQLHSTTIRSTTLHYTKLHYTALHYTTLHYTTLHYTTFHYTSLHYTTLHSTTLQLQLRLHNYTPLHEITLHYTTVHYTTLHSTTLHYTTLHYTTIHWMTLHHR